MVRIEDPCVGGGWVRLAASLAIASLLLVSFASGQSPTLFQPPQIVEANASSAIESFQTAASDVPVAGKIGQGDLLAIQVFDVPELVRRVRVDDAGNISLPFLHTIHVAGLTSTELEQRLGRLLVAAQYVLAPVVSVQIVETANHGLTILGEVQRPGVYPGYGTRTLIDVIAMAQGLTQFAGLQVAVIREGKGEAPSETYALRLDNGLLSPPFVRIYPGDTVIVRRALLVYVLGDVGKPGAYPYDHRSMSVLDAVALAQGLNPTASLNKAVILHRSGGGLQSQPLRLKGILAAKDPDRLVADGDIIYVPTSHASTMLMNSVPSIVGSAIGASIYALSVR